MRFFRKSSSVIVDLQGLQGTVCPAYESKGRGFKSRRAQASQHRTSDDILPALFCVDGASERFHGMIVQAFFGYPKLVRELSAIIRIICVLDMENNIHAKRNLITDREFVIEGSTLGRIIMIFRPKV